MIHTHEGHTVGRTVDMDVFKYNGILMAGGIERLLDRLLGRKTSRKVDSRDPLAPARVLS